MLAGRQAPCLPVFKKIARLVGRIGSAAVRVSASFQKNARLVGLLGSGPRLMADRADIVPADRVDGPVRVN